MNTKQMRLWSLIASLFCSLSLYDALFELGANAGFAAMGGGESVLQLANVAARMGASDTRLVPVAAPKGAAVASQAPSAEAGYREIAQWVQQTGGDSIIPAVVAQSLGYRVDANMKVKHKGLVLDSDPTQRFFFDVVPGADAEYVLHMRRPAMAVSWRVKGEQLLRTVMTTAEGVSQVSNDRYRDELSLAKRVFLQNMPPPEVAQAPLAPKS